MDIEILHEDRLRAWGERLKLPEGGLEALVNVAREVNADPELHNAFTDFYTRTALNGEWHREWSDIPKDPSVVSKLDGRASLFYLLAYMAALPNAERVYRRMGIPLQVFQDTMYDIAIWMNEAHLVHGDWRFDQFSWIWLHLDCKIFRLGRLQFMLGDFDGGVTAFRHRQTGQVLLLGDPKMPLRADGYADGSAGKPLEEDAWHAAFEATPAGWRGNRVMPQGYTLREESFLLRSEWELALKHGDRILDLHIPRGEKMTPKECRGSFQQAFAFFPEFFPDQPFKGVFCHTWFFTPQLQQILPADSNIVRFQREFYLYPHPGGPGFLWSYVFGERYPEPDGAPRDTGLRRAVLDWIQQGGELFDLPGVMIHHPEQWGTQPYYNKTEG